MNRGQIAIVAKAIPGWNEDKERNYLRVAHNYFIQAHNRATGHSHQTIEATDLCNLMGEETRRQQ